ncbi:MAG: ABC transporter permease [Lachnospiraceae bacterium]|nr:ABC transporter permease [Lachnospiraceae bacterium]
MKSLYCRLAVTNLKNNKQFYIPYLLMGILSVMMFYCMRAMQGSQALGEMRGGAEVALILLLGLVVVGICACIFLFYTNSFVMKRRKKELGIYNILGMEKKHIAKVMVWESSLLYVISVGGGLLFGILFNKLLTMFLYKLVGFSESIPFYISWSGCLQTLAFFAVMYLLILVYNCLQVKLANPIALLHSANAGEKEPKSKWLLGILGAACMVGGYWLALTIQSAVEAITFFFVAVVLVIIGTYALFSVISILVLKALKKNKKYYYQTRHFTSVSGMIYRMKQNATGLANICILSTMVLVMVSTTVCLYAGVDDAVNARQETELDVQFNLEGILEDAQRKELSDKMTKLITDENREISMQKDYMECYWFTHTKGESVEAIDDENRGSFKDVSMLQVMTEEDYETYSGQQIESVEPGKVIVAALPAWKSDNIKIFGKEYEVQSKPQYPDRGESGMLYGDGGYMFVIVPDKEAIGEIRKLGQAEVKNVSERFQYHVLADIDGDSEQKKACANAVSKGFDGEDMICFSKTSYRESQMEMSGGFLFLGLFFGTLFLMITVLIIYYKQISEGYEDRERFHIMTKVGMSRKEVKASINSQVCTVFFLPIVVAVIHLFGAFPMLELMLSAFNLYNEKLFLICLFGTVAVFAIIYFVVYKLTSKSYYKIVYK